jgi:dihydroorotase
VKNGVLTLKELARKMSSAPAKLLGLEAGAIKAGMPADLVLIDTERQITIDREKLLSKGKNTPFHGRTYSGDIVMTIAGGKIVFCNI